jgi:hypothetical protein
MSNIQFNLANYSYPSLESNYLPNISVNSRVMRYLNTVPKRNTNTNINNNPIFKTIKTAMNKKTTKYNIVHFMLDTSGVFEAYINNLLGCSSINAELLVAIDVSTNTNIYPIIQPTFNYNKSNGYLTLNLTPEYDNYMLTFLITGEKQNGLTVYIEGYYKPNSIPSN